MPRSFLEGLLLHWLENYDDVFNAALSLLYAQIFVGLAGTLHTANTGLQDADVAVSLFGLVAVASGYQSLGRTYAALLVCMLVLDASWLLLYAPQLWHTDFWGRDGFTSWALLGASTLGFLLRFISALLWGQMFRLGWGQGEPYGAGTPFFGQLGDYDQISRAGRTPADQSPSFSRQLSHSDEFLGSSIFHPPSFAALVHPGQLNDYLREDALAYSQTSHDGGFEPPAGIPEEHESPMPQAAEEDLASYENLPGKRPRT